MQRLALTGFARLPRAIAARVLQAAVTAPEPDAPRNAAGQLVAAWLEAKLRAATRPLHGYVPQGTPARRRKRPDRAARKALARKLALANFEWVRANGVPLHHHPAHRRAVICARQALAA